jgi:hypothetical protein
VWWEQVCKVCVVDVAATQQCGSRGACRHTMMYSEAEVQGKRHQHQQKKNSHSRVALEGPAGKVVVPIMIIVHHLH